MWIFSDVPGTDDRRSIKARVSEDLIMLRQHPNQIPRQPYLIALPIGLLLNLLAVLAVHAQQDSDSGDSSTGRLEEIVVTGLKSGARKSQDTPAAIQAIGGQTLVDMGAKTFVDFAVSVPSLQFQDLGPGDKEYIIRGINSSGPSTVGVYYDEAVVTGSNKEDGGGRNVDIKLYDLERIEVLKGPQGTLYGANSMAGTIRYITNKPKLDTFEGYVDSRLSATHKGDTSYDINAMVNIPVVEGLLGVRAVGWINRDGGFIDGVRIPSGRRNDINNDDTEGGRLLVRWTPKDDLVVTASATAQKLKSNGSSRYTPKGENSFDLSGLGFPSVPGGDLINTDIAQSPWLEDLQIYSLVAEYSTPVGVLTATTNYMKRDIRFLFDTSPFLAANPGFQAALPFPFTTSELRDRMVSSSELRFASRLNGPWQFVVGGFYQEDEIDFRVDTGRINNDGMLRGPFSSLDADDAITNFPDGNTIFGRINDTTTEQLALFGELTFDITDKLSATAGLRYFDSTLRANEVTTHPFFGFGGPPVLDVLKTRDSQDKNTVKYNLSYTLSDDLLLYATASEGFRIGGLNPANLPFAGSEIPRGFSPDKLWNYELGAKSEFLDGKARVNLAGYIIIWKDLQLEARTSDGIFPFISNFGEAKVSGLEFETDIRPIEQLQLSLNGSYQYARLTEDTLDTGNPSARGLSGDRIPNIPRFQGHFSATYSAPVSQRFTGRLRSDITYRGESKTEFSSRNPFNVNLDNYFLINLRASVESDAWTVTVFVDNVTDKRAQFDAIDSEQDGSAFLTAVPRSIGVSVNWRF